MDETEKRTTSPAVSTEINYVRDTPEVKVHRVGEHYVVKAGCRTGVFHSPREVEDFLHRLLVEWVSNELMDPRKILDLPGMDRIRPTAGLPKYAQEEPERR